VGGGGGRTGVEGGRREADPWGEGAARGEGAAVDGQR
jgi:hypothetical protein